MQRSRRTHHNLLFLTLLLALAVLSGCTSARVSDLKDFTSDGCSLFPDGTISDRGKWCQCCLLHDIAYWRGGTAQERKRADEVLRECVFDRTKDAALAETMYVGVRTGGHPVFPTWYRWAYGWPYDRGYKPLMEEEQLQVRGKLDDYWKKYPKGYCVEKHGTESSARAADSFVLVSDVDDTVKITNVLDNDEMVTNALTSELVFAGMPELYRYILGNNSPAWRLRFLSGSPFILSHKVRELLNHAHFPAHRLTLRGGTDLPSSAFEFKTKHMEELYGESGDNFLLVGDDTESDPAVYEAFSVPRPNRVLAIYIHRITGKELPLGSIAFVTAYDIAMHEFVAGRLSEKQAADVGNAVFNSKDSTFLPDFQQCPKEYEQIAGLSEALVKLKKQIDGRITALCSSRTNMSRSN